MKKLLAMGLLGVGLLAGCNEPIPAFSDPHTALQVSIKDYGLQWKLRVQPPVAERVPGGQLKVSVQIYNTTEDDMPLDYSYSFTDKNGVQNEDSSMSGLHAVKIPARGYQTITFMSMTPAADNFRVYLRPATFRIPSIDKRSLQRELAVCRLLMRNGFWITCLLRCLRARK